MQNMESCKTCNFSLVNMKGDMECRKESPPFHVILPIDWCDNYNANNLRYHTRRKEWYAAELEKIRAEKKAETIAKQKATREKNKEANDSENTDDDAGDNTDDKQAV